MKNAKRETGRKAISASKRCGGGKRNSKATGKGKKGKIYPVSISSHETIWFATKDDAKRFEEKLREPEVRRNLGMPPLDIKKAMDDYFKGRGMVKDLPDYDLEIKKFPPKRNDVFDPETGEEITDEALKLK